MATPMAAIWILLLNLVLSPNAGADVHSHPQTYNNDRVIVDFTNDRPWQVTAYYTLIIDSKCGEQYRTWEHYEGGDHVDIGPNGSSRIVHYLPPCAVASQVSHAEARLTGVSAPPRESHQQPVIQADSTRQTGNGQSAETQADHDQGSAQQGSPVPDHPLGPQVVVPTDQPSATDPNTAWQDFLAKTVTTNFTDSENRMRCTHIARLQTGASSCAIQIETTRRCREDCGLGNCSIIDVDTYQIDMTRFTGAFCQPFSDGGCNLEFLTLPDGISLHSTSEDTEYEENNTSRHSQTGAGYLQFSQSDEGQAAARALSTLGRVCKNPAPAPQPQPQPQPAPQPPRHVRKECQATLGQWASPRTLNSGDQTTVSEALEDGVVVQHATVNGQALPDVFARLYYISNNSLQVEAEPNGLWRVSVDVVPEANADSAHSGFGMEFNTEAEARRAAAELRAIHDHCTGLDTLPGYGKVASDPSSSKAVTVTATAPDHRPARKGSAKPAG